NAGSSLSIGIFFSLMIAGLASSLPKTLFGGLTAEGVPAGVAHQVAGLPPVGSLFAAFLGYNPMQTLLSPSGVLHNLPQSSVDHLPGKQFSPQLMTQPFHQGLVIVFTAAALMTLVGAAACLLTSGRPAPLEQPFDTDNADGVEALIEPDKPASATAVAGHAA